MEEDERQEREAAANAGHLRTFLAPEIIPHTSMSWSEPMSAVEFRTEGSWNFSVAPQQTWGPVINSASNRALTTPSTSTIPQYAPANAGQKDAAQLVRALESHVAFIEGDPALQEDLELYYYRISGSTAIHPGINRISLKLQPRPSSDVLSMLSSPLPSFQPGHATQERPEDIFEENSLPRPNIYIPLLDTFFRTMSRHFPSVSRKRMEQRLETGTMSAFLLNCICALGARFHPSAQDNPHKASAPFITKAQELVIPLLHLPTTDVVTGLLLLAWANYGQNSESGQWQYSGMAIRMALDLGIHENSEIYESHAHLVRVRLLFWSIFVTDRILAFSTGRPPSISEELIEIPLPTDRDFIPDAARSDPGAATEPPQPTPFMYTVRLMVLCGRIASALNGRRGQLRTLVTGPDPSASPDLLRGLQAKLVRFYAELPDAMKWSVEAFKVQEARGHGDSFLTLHLWANSVMTLVFHPELMSSTSSIGTPLSHNLDRSIKLSLSSSRIITECLVFADLFASHSYLANPFAVQPLYVACLAFIHDIRANETDFPVDVEKPQTVDRLLNSLARQNLSILTKALQRMEHYWAGVSYVLNTLEKRAAGLGYQRIDTSKSKKTFISLPDKGLLRRFTSPNLPHDTSAATDTTLRASMAREAAAQEANTCSLDDLLTTYSIEGCFVHPADPFDLERLLESGYCGDPNGNESSR